MIKLVDLLAVLHSIDVLKNRVCAACRFRPNNQCLKGFKPHGLDDGCDEFKKKK